MSQPVLLLIIFLLFKSLYAPLNRRQSRYYWKKSVDDRIPLIAWFVYPYVGFLPYIAISIAFVWNTSHIVSFLASLSIAYALASLFWYLFPNGVKRPDVIERRLQHRLLVYIYKTDRDTNGFPSAHVFTSLICAYYLTTAFPGYSVISWLIGLLIAISTIFTKQHYVLDLLGGFIVFVLSILVVR